MTLCERTFATFISSTRFTGDELRRSRVSTPESMIPTGIDSCS
ncbi:Uncharacterised protein [Mycobacteroides abscessus subsp. abscessus]|nr:Uncharacterised protein [Mycobacteroides abscessus subsp. abscessus]